MKEVVSQFMHLIRSTRFDIEQAANLKIVERCELLLIDSSRLIAYESSTGTKFKYGYQWINSANQTIYRWDNATHYPQFETYPYHRHIGANETAEPFSRVSLIDVLRFIDAQLILPK